LQPAPPIPQATIVDLSRCIALNHSELAATAFRRLDCQGSVHKLLQLPKLAAYLRSTELAAKNEAEPWHIPNGDRSMINLEHILPEKKEGNWPVFTDEQVKLYYKRVGNLCLMRASDNSAAKSAGFGVKKPIFATSP
jgi:hypothetical protein